MQKKFSYTGFGIMVLVILLCIIMTGCKDTEHSDVPTELTESEIKDKLWLPNAEKGEVLLLNRYDSRIVSYNVKKKKITEVNGWEDYFQYGFSNSDRYYTAGGSTYGHFSIWKREKEKLSQVLSMKDNKDVFPCAYDKNTDQFYFTISPQDDSDSNATIALLEEDSLVEYKNTRGKITTGITNNNRIYYFAYEEKEDTFTLYSIKEKDFDGKPTVEKRNCKTDELFSYRGRILIGSDEKIKDLKGETLFDLKSENYFDEINGLLMQIYIKDQTLYMDVLDCTSKKVLLTVRDPIDYRVKKGYVRVFGDGVVKDIKL